MANFFDVSGLEQFSKIFVFLIVVLALYSVFAYNKAFANSKWIAWIIAIAVGIFVILSDLATGIIRYVTPWFAVLFIFVIFIAIAAQIFGAKVSDISEYKWILFTVIAIVFVVGTLSYIRGQVTAPGDTDDNGNVIKEADYSSMSNFIFHPKFMGIIFILLVAIFTVALLAGKSS